MESTRLLPLMSDYQAGACNIGGQERSMRRLAGYGSLAAAAVYLAAVVALELPDSYVLGVGAFLFGGAIGLLQSRERFCVAYGMAGRYGFDDGSGAVEDAAARSRDRKRAAVIAGKAAAVAVVGTAVAYGLVTLL